MTFTRRQFVASSAAGLAGATLWPAALAGADASAKRPLRILILGGTGFLGRLAPNRPWPAATK